MLKIERLENHKNLESVLESKKKIFNLMVKVNGSMNTFHKEIKTLREIEVLAEDYFISKEEIKVLKEKSFGLNESSVIEKLKNIKNSKIAVSIDFI